MTKVVIDLETILDPHKLLHVIGSIDTVYSEILVPDSYRFIEMWNENRHPLTLHLFDDPTIQECTLDTQFGFSANCVERTNFIAGLKILRLAYDAGMVTLFPIKEYSKIGKEILKTDRGYGDWYQKVTPVDRVNINADLVGVTLEGLIGAHFKLDAAPIIGDESFLLYYANNKPDGQLFNHKGKIHIEEDLNALLHSPMFSNVKEAFEYSKNFKLTSDCNKFLTQVEISRTRESEIIVTGLEFSTTVLADTYLFSGIPVTTATVALYKIGKRIVRII